MVRLIGVVISIGLADSLNPTTIAPALYLASGKRAKEDVTEFTLGVFLVYFLGGALIALGPGQLLLSLVPKPTAHTRYILELIAGIAMVIASAMLWRNRGRLAHRKLPQSSANGKSSAILGATISAVELPTAFPYFAAIAAIIGSGLGPVHQLVALIVFNLCFVLPLIAIAATVWLGGDQAEQRLTTAREFLQRHWPVIVAGLALVAGVFCVTLGITGLTEAHHPRIRRFRHIIAA